MAFLIASNFVIHPQILVFLLFKTACLFSLWTKTCSQSLHLTIGRTTASMQPVTQESTALPLSACCVVARRSASRLWSQWPCQSTAVLHSFCWAKHKVRWSLLPGRATETADAASPAPYCYDYEPASKHKDCHFKQINTYFLSTRCNQRALFRATECYHTTTGSFWSHPHYIEENSCAFVCLNILNILLAHEYTQNTQLHE